VFAKTSGGTKLPNERDAIQKAKLGNPSIYEDEVCCVSMERMVFPESEKTTSWIIF